MGHSYIPATRKEYTWESENPYYEGQKYPEPTVCPECGVIFKDGRWQWKKDLKEKLPQDVNKSLCPACRRKRDRYPGGIVILKGNFLKEHKEEILNRIRNIVEDVSALRPLQRILWMDEKNDGTMEIATTSEHLARHIGEAINSAFKGNFEVKYNENEKFARIVWERD
ncbi:MULTISPECIES: BCAM0308 family protein [unclassified Desulfurobacterium]|uniref:BCAM0308 family protein n=1 Tax=Desulfurobacterium sp. TC5-1 TaxID=1158318 RepID=UPI0003B597BE|nr:BCAM0308 family protein [Desulfurobacterium sp. TC5-1]